MDLLISTRANLGDVCDSSYLAESFVGEFIECIRGVARIALEPVLTKSSLLICIAGAKEACAITLRDSGLLGVRIGD